MNNNEITERCVLLSLNPYWWQKIYDGFKNLEIRKNGTERLHVADSSACVSNYTAERDRWRVYLRGIC